jgi:hypothetical protein
MGVPLILNNCLKSVPNFIFMLKSIYFYNRRSVIGMKKSGQIVASKFIIVFMVICSVAVLILSTGLAQNIIGWINDPTEGSITGIVTDADTGEPIPDTLMTLKYHGVVRTELTDSNGRYKFTGVPICFCMKNVSASKNGYESQYKMVAVQKITHVDFSLEPIEDGSGSMYGIITGIVTDAETNDPIPDALMTLKYHGLIRTEFTDSNGWYTFTEVPICFCLKNVSASKNGYESQYKLVAVSEITYANFSLEPLPEDASDADSNLVSGGSQGRETPIESKGYFLIMTGLVAALSVLLIGINIRKIIKIAHDRE